MCPVVVDELVLLRRKPQHPSCIFIRGVLDRPQLLPVDGQLHFSNHYHCVSLISYTEQAVPVDRGAMDEAHYNFYRTDSVDL